MLRRCYVETGYGMTHFELARHLLEAGDVSVRYLWRGTVHEYDGARSAAALEAPSWLRRKLLVFRPLGEASRAECLW
jgi:hypothetical protein